MEHLFVCQLLGGHTLCSRVIGHGTSAGLSAPGGSYTVFQGYRPWNICWSVSSWGVVHCVPGL